MDVPRGASDIHLFKVGRSRRRNDHFCQKVSFRVHETLVVDSDRLQSWRLTWGFNLNLEAILEAISQASWRLKGPIWELSKGILP